MSSLECNSLSSRVTKSSVGKINAFNGRRIQIFATSDNVRNLIRVESKLHAQIYKESTSPIRPSVSSDLFGVDQTVEDSINVPLEDFEVTFFNYKRLIELATTIDPDTGEVALDSGKYYKLLIFLVVNFGIDLAYSLFIPPDKPNSGSSYADCKGLFNLRNLSVPQQVRKAYNTKDLQTQINTLLGGSDVAAQKIKQSGILALDSIQASLYSLLTPLNSKRIYTESPRIEFCSNPDTDDTVEDRYQLKTINSNSSVYASLAFIGLAMRERIHGNSSLTNKYADKISGHYDEWDDNKDFQARQRLYPIKDVIIEKDGVSFVNEKIETSGLFRSIDNTIVFGNYARDRERIAGLSADDNSTYITPSSIYTAGSFQYQCEVTPPLLTPKDNYLFIRAAAPISTNETDIAPDYKAYNIKLLDPSGNTITKYKDFVIRGDCDYSKDPKSNFTTYIIEPQKNYAALPSYYATFPLLGKPSGYKLNIEFEAICRAKPFTKDFTKGYENTCTLQEKFVDTDEDDYLAIDGAPFSTINQDFHLKPNNSIRISEIEILADGSQDGFLSEGILNLTLQPEPTGTLFEREIYVGRVLNGTEFVNNIYPEDSSSIWKTSPDYDGNVYYSSDTDNRSRSELLDRLTNLNIAGNLKLDQTSPTGSGRLEVIFEHKKPYIVKRPTGGGIGFGSKYQGTFQKAELQFVETDDSFFTIDEISLHVKAKKADASVPDIFFDVVGYSDDCLLNVSSSPNGFLQNAGSGIGISPVSSGYTVLNELAIAGEGLSEKENYFVTRSPSRGDHYVLTQTPKITSTEFQTINVPLKIHQEQIDIFNRTPNYTMSSFFEKLYVDIYPLPSGTIISELILKVKHKPSAGMMMYTLGHELDTILRHTEVRLTPAAEKDYVNHVNQTISDSTKLSLIENIPHGYGNPETLKTNYSRRWRGCEGSFYTGPFNPNEFAFDYYNPQVDSPFTYFYSDFSDVNKQVNHHWINSQVTDRHVVYDGDLENNIITNRGLRFNSNKLFPSQTVDYTTLDWTQDGDVLSGHILDAFNNGVKVLESSGCMNFGNAVATSGGFSIFTRFSPDISISGVNHNLFNSGVLISKWDSDKELEFLLGYKDGKLLAMASDIDGNKISISDTSDFSEYQYPLSVLLTYNDNQSKKLKLYTQNEIYNGPFDIKRSESEEFELLSGNSDLVYGYSYGSGVGFNAYFTEIGISDSNERGGNIVEGAADPSVRQGNVQSFFDSHSVKFFRRLENLENSHNNLWKFVDEDTRKWHIGAFKYCEFSGDFDILSNRQGKDYIYHSYRGFGSTYDEIVDLQLPSNIKLDGVAYHTQVENDMLRFNLGDIEDRFYAVAPRISKKIPRGYNILDNAISVNTVIQHFCDADIVWPDGKVGAKLIVSLYTKSRENPFRESTNWGLVNRRVHYITPEDCWKKLNSNLTYGEICSNDEPWSNFVHEKITEETKETYFLNDINQMFIQYDLVYPSGEFNSTLRLSSVDVVVGDMLVKKDDVETDLPLYSSGSLEYRDRINFSIQCSAPISDNLQLYSSGADPIEINTFMPLFMGTGTFKDNMSLSLYTIKAQSIFDSFTQSAPKLFADSDFDEFRDDVRILLPFDNTLDDLSFNNYQASLPSDPSQILAADTSFPTYSSTNSKFGSSAIFNYDPAPANRSKGVQFEDLLFNPEDFDGDWFIDFWLNILYTDETEVEIGGAGAFTSNTFLRADATRGNSLDIFNMFTTIPMGFGFANFKRIGIKLCFFSGRLGILFGAMDNLSQQEKDNGRFAENSTASVGNILFQSADYNFLVYLYTTVNYVDLKNNWNKISIRKHNNTIEVYLGTTVVGQYEFDEKVKFDTIDTSAHSYPYLRMFGTSIMHFALDDFRITLGSSRGTENPGLVLTPSPNPSVEPPPPPPPPDPEDPCNCETYAFCCVDDPRVGNFTFPFYIEGAYEKDRDIVPFTIIADGPQDNGSLLLFAGGDKIQTEVDGNIPLVIGDSEIDFGQIVLDRTSTASTVLFVQTEEEDLISQTQIPMYIGGTIGTFDLDSSFILYLLHESPIAQNPDDIRLEAFSWDGENVGKLIEVRDNPLASIPANDEIRGVNTICFGTCGFNSSYPCFEPDIITHDTVWFSSECFNGGVFRSFTHYTNLDVGAFGGEYPYVRNFYGMRKFDGLLPFNPYEITISVFTGTDKIFAVPKEIKEWEYGTNEDVDYKPQKIVAEEGDRIENINFGKSVAVNDDLMVVGVPNKTLSDSNGHVMPKCGEIHVYRRLPAPSGYDWSDQDDKSDWQLEAKLSIPAEYRRDKFTTAVKQFFDEKGKPLPFEGSTKSWTNQQNGRELGYSVDCTKTEDGREIIVAGGPGSIFDREFNPVASNPVEIALFIITNEFNPLLNAQEILDALRDKDILYRYFSDPPVKFSVKVIICEAILDTDTPSGGEIPEPKPSFVSQYQIHKHTNFDISTQAYKDKESLILNELKEIFHEVFPLRENVLNSGIPGLLSIYLDTSSSLGTRAMGQDKVVGKGVLDQFIDYYKEYSYNNGLQNVQTPPAPASGFAFITLDNTEGWIRESSQALNDITDTGRMIENDTFKLFANNLGSFNADADEFNFLPPSGGCVYVFEKPKDQNYWHIIQEINSPSSYTDDVPDRFGHAVSISDNGRVIAVGSPYCQQNVSIYESNDNSFDFNFNLDFTVLFNLQTWLDQNYRSTLAIQLRNALAAGVEPSIVVARRFYDNNLSGSQKYDFLINYIQKDTPDENLDLESYGRPYRLIHSIDSQASEGSWDNLFNQLIPTPRLGYSIDVNEDGTAVAIGSPTDSLGARDSFLTAFRYYSGKGISGLGDLSHHWQNYSYAGAVRLLQARNYYPHNKVVEYGRFGNLHETINRNESNGYLFTQFRESVFNNGGVQYVKTNFVEADIPQDAGTLFIITPEVDAASEETIQKIKNWLSLGDRNLVLVGDDPFYEADGTYRSSNDIVNYILERLDINLRIFTARNEYEARVNPEKFDNLKLNALPVPAWSSRKTSASVTTTTSDIYAGVLSASGVGDIRLYDPDIDTRYTCFYKPPSSDSFALIGCATQPYRDVNYRCNMPITHLGDLRASWTDQCVKITPNGCSTISYPVNTAFVYGSTNLDYFGCGAYDAPKILPKHTNFRNKSEPMPLIAAAERISKTINVEAIEPTEIKVPFQIGEKVENILRRDVATTPNSGVKFVWSAEEEGYSSLILNLNNITSNSLFFDPPEYNEHDAVLAAASEIKEQTVSKKVPYGRAVYAAEEKYGLGQSESIVTLIAGTYTEDVQAINRTFADQGYNFYGNILRYVDKISPKLAQVGGFTSRSSFADGYANSNMPAVLEAFGISYDAGVSLEDLVNPSNAYDIAWIANSLEYASDLDIARLKEFLSLGNKKLIITYGHNPSRTSEFNSGSHSIEQYDQSSILAAKVAQDLCERIGLSMKPLFLPTSNHYAAKSDTSLLDNATDLGLSTIRANQSSRIFRFNNDSEFTFEYYSFSRFVPSRNKTVVVDYPQDLIFIDIGTRGYSLAFFEGGEDSSGAIDIKRVYDLSFSTEGAPLFRTGITQVVFDLPERDIENNEDEFNIYQVIFDLVSETPYEREAIYAYTDAIYISTFDGIKIPTESAFRVPFQELPIPEAPLTTLFDVDSFGNSIATPVRGNPVRLITNSSSIQHKSVLYQVPSDQKQLTMHFYQNVNHEFETNPDPLRTIRLVSVSGVRVPSVQSSTIIKSPIMDFRTELTGGSPAFSYDVDIVRRITTDSDKYCPDTDSGNHCAMPEPTGYNTPGPEIEDGPVIVAQAIYHQGGYFNGYNKSTVTVISDASLIQGPNILVDGQSTSQDLPDFLFSLYPSVFWSFDEFSGTEQTTGLRYESDYKIISPERGSPSRFINSYPHLSGLNARFGGYQVINAISHDKFSDLEGSFDLTPRGPKSLVDFPNRGMLSLMDAVDQGVFLKEPTPPQNPPKYFFNEPPYTYAGYTKEEYEKLWYEDNIQLVEDAYYVNSKIIDYDGASAYEDAGFFERIPPILRETGFDHLDIEHYGSGYPGDLFGFSVKFHKGDLYVSSPFSAYSGSGITTWDKVVEDNPGTGAILGIEIGNRGGAGVVYRLEDTLGERQGAGSVFGQKTPANNIPWAVKEKIIPEQLHLGYDGQTPETASGIIGSHSYDQEFLDKHFGMPDLFGYHIDAAGDVLAISAPGHDFDIIYEDTEAAFIRKEFNEQFNIQKRIPHDIALDSVRQSMPNSGVNILNRGSIFTYENRITDWGAKTQSWQLIHKLNPIGHNANIQNSGENTFFGQSFAIDRSYRSDSDYILAIGNKNHQFDNSSDVPVSGAGAVFAYDGMLRKLRPAYSHPDTFIAGSVFGDKEQDIVDFNVKNDNRFNYLQEITGVITSNQYGEIYIEASGYDKLDRSYSANRPYVYSITGKVKRGIPIIQYGRLFVEGSPFIDETSIEMFVGVENQLEVYNTLDLFTQSAYMSSGSLPLYASGSPPESGFFPLMTSGSFPPENTFLNAFIRGF